MSMFINAATQEMRGLVVFNRAMTKIGTILERLETGYRINSAKDDPSGLIVRDGMRSDITAMNAAVKNSNRANSFLTAAEGALGNIAAMLNGDPSDGTNAGLIAILQDSTMTGTQKKEAVTQVLQGIDKLVKTTQYGDQNLIDGTFDYRTSSSANISDLQVTRAQSMKNPINLSFNVEQAASQAGVVMDYSDAQAGSVRAGETISLSFTGSQGNDIRVNLTGAGQIGDGTWTQYSADQLLAEINTALANEGETSIRAEKDSTGNLRVVSNEKGASQTVQVRVAGSDSDVGQSNFLFADMLTQNPLSNQASSVGRDWLFSGLEGSVSSNGDKISVSSNVADFSANLKNAQKGDTIRLSINGGGASFQIGKDVRASNRLDISIKSATTSNLGGSSGKLRDILSMDLENGADLTQAIAITTQAIENLALERGRIGTLQSAFLEPNTANLQDRILLTTEDEAALSNTDAALETSNLARQELIAEAALNAIGYYRSFYQYALGKLL